MAWVGGTVTSAGGNISLTIEGGYANVVRNGDTVTGNLGLRFIFNQNKWSSNSILGTYNGVTHFAQNRVGGDDSYCSTLGSILYCTKDLGSGPNYNESYPWSFSTTVSGNGGGSIAITMSAGWKDWPGTTPYSYTFYVPYPEKPKVWNDVNIYNPNGVQDYESGYFDLYTSENDSWRYNLLNEDADMTHTIGTFFQVQNIRPYYDYYEVSSVTGYDSIPATGAYRKTFDTANEVLEIYMKYKSYSITVNKGTGIDSVSRSASSVAYGSSASINATVSTGYHWKNWTGTFTTTTQNYSWTMSNKNYSLTANAEPNTYTVQYNGNGATGGSTASSSHTYNSAKNLTSNGFTRTHYTFKNWNTKADGTGTSYSNGASVSNLTATHGGTVTLYAQWTGNTYTVSYDANGGTSTPGSQSVQYPGTVNLAGAISKNNTTENGYTITYNANGGSGAPSSQTSGSRTVTWSFSKWAAGSTSGSQYSAGASYQPTSTITMYAIWTKNVSANSSWTCSSTQPKKTGHSFLGWSESSTATSATYTAGTTYTITKGLTLYAVWQKNNYYLDVNGYLDGADNGSLTEYGTFDISVNGTSVGNDVNDYYTQHPYGSSYSITDIKANNGYQYNGIHSGTLTGTIGDNETTTGVRLNFSTKKPENVVLTYNITSPFNVDLQWSADGLNMTYRLNTVDSQGNVYVRDCGGRVSTSITTQEESTYQFFIEAVNPGGTVKSNIVIITTPADQAKIRIKQEGEWVKGKTYYKQDGTWKKVKKIYIKKNGVWYVGNNYDS